MVLLYVLTRGSTGGSYGCGPAVILAIFELCTCMVFPLSFSLNRRPVLGRES